MEATKDETVCVTKGCERAPALKFTWPGRDESVACAVCAARAAAVARAMGLYLQVRPAENR